MKPPVDRALPGWERLHHGEMAAYRVKRSLSSASRGPRRVVDPERESRIAAMIANHEAGREALSGRALSWSAAAEVAHQGGQRSPALHFAPRLLAHDGRRLTVSEWSRIVGVSAATIHQRLRRGWSAAKVLTTPASETKRRKPRRSA
ncbi:MAG: hypothetical protein ACRDD1_04285 [Planctomycetia bacterium]